MREVGRHRAERDLDLVRPGATDMADQHRIASRGGGVARTEEVAMREVGRHGLEAGRELLALVADDGSVRVGNGEYLGVAGWFGVETRGSARRQKENDSCERGLGNVHYKPPSWRRTYHAARGRRKPY